MKQHSRYVLEKLALTCCSPNLEQKEQKSYDWFSNLLVYTAGEFVCCDRPFYLVKQPKEKWACDFHDDGPPFAFQLQVAEVIF